MSDELKPCPCGKPALTEECPYPINFDRKLWKVCCEDDGCGWEAIGIGPEGAIAAWNRRSPTGGQDAERYRFIRPMSFTRQLNVVDGDLTPLNGEELDAAIDAAMKEGGK